MHTYTHPRTDWRPLIWAAIAALGLHAVAFLVIGWYLLMTGGGGKDPRPEPDPPEMQIALDQVRAARQACPYAPEGEEAHKQVHLMFIKGDIKTYDPDGLATLATQGERFHMGEGVFYLYTPQGFGKSVVAEKLPRFLKARTTARNLRTVETLIEMAAD